MVHSQAKNTLLAGTIFLALAVALGAFAAHGLEGLVEPRMLLIFETGVRYQIYHAFGLLFLGLLKLIRPAFPAKLTGFAFIAGIIFFSFNCYIYAVTGIKPFAMIIPVGGTLFILGWLNFSWQIFKLRT